MEISALEARTRKVCWAFRVFLCFFIAFASSVALLRHCNNFIKLPGFSVKDGRGGNIHRFAHVIPERAELTFRYNLGMHVEA